MEKNSFLAGAAKGEITPKKELLPMPLIWGIRFNEVLDPLYVRAIAMSDGVRQCLFVTFEITAVPYAEETLEFLEKETGIPKTYIFLCAIHTHGITPYLPGFYKETSRAEKKSRRWYEDIKCVLADTVKKALASMVPAKIGYGTGASYFNVCRDGVFGDVSKMGINYDHPSDHTIRMVRFDDMEGKTIALIANFACHAVIMNGCLRKGLKTPITGDFPGRTCAKLEEQMDSAVVLWCSGAAGDQNPWIMSQCAMEENGKYKNKNIGKVAEWILEHLSREHARDILEANSRIICDMADGSILCKEKIVPVEAKKDGEKEIPYTLRLLQIGDIAFEGISAEIVTSVGKAVREVSPLEKTILVSHANGYHGYVADDWEFEHNAFEAGNCLSKKGMAQTAFVKGFQELFAENDQLK